MGGTLACSPRASRGPSYLLGVLGSRDVKLLQSGVGAGFQPHLLLDVQESGQWGGHVPGGLGEVRRPHGCPPPLENKELLLPSVATWPSEECPGRLGSKLGSVTATAPCFRSPMAARGTEPPWGAPSDLPAGPSSPPALKSPMTRDLCSRPQLGLAPGSNWEEVTEATRVGAGGGRIRELPQGRSCALAPGSLISTPILGWGAVRQDQLGLICLRQALPQGTALTPAAAGPILAGSDGGHQERPPKPAVLSLRSRQSSQRAPPPPQCPAVGAQQSQSVPVATRWPPGTATTTGRHKAPHCAARGPALPPRGLGGWTAAQPRAQGSLGWEEEGVRWSGGVQDT